MDAIKGIRKVGSTEEHCKKLLQSSGVALVVTHGLEQDVEIVNDRFTALFGYTIEDIPDVSHWWPLAYPDETNREAVKAEWQRRVAEAIANQSEIEPMEAKVRCKDGSERYIEFHSSSIGDTNLVSFVDLTERTRAEIALRESEERFRLMADTAPVLMWMSGTDKLCTYFNKSWLDFTGRSMEQELGNGWAQGVHPDDLQPCLDTYRQSFDRRVQFRMEYRLRHYDGEYRWVLDIGAPRFNQDRSFAGYIGAVVDISERKMAEERLRESEEQLHINEERLRLAQKVASIGTFEWNLKTGVNTWTGELEAMYGLPVGAFGRTQSAFEKLIHPDDRANVVRLVDYALKSGEPTEAEWRVVWSDRSVHWIVGTLAGFCERVWSGNANDRRKCRCHSAQAGRRGAVGSKPQADRSAGARTRPDWERATRRHQPTARNVGVRTGRAPRKSCGGWEPRASTTEKDGGDFGRRASPVTRVALFRTGISRCRSGLEKLVRGICQAAKIGDRLHR